MEIIGYNDNLTNKYLNVDDKFRIMLHIYWSADKRGTCLRPGGGVQSPWV